MGRQMRFFLFFKGPPQADEVFSRRQPSKACHGDSRSVSKLDAKVKALQQVGCKQVGFPRGSAASWIPQGL